MKMVLGVIAKKKSSDNKIDDKTQAMDRKSIEIQSAWGLTAIPEQQDSDFSSRAAENTQNSNID